MAWTWNLNAASEPPRPGLVFGTLVRSVDTSSRSRSFLSAREMLFWHSKSATIAKSA